jgi:hypothetical protein
VSRVATSIRTRAGFAAQRQTNSKFVLTPVKVLPRRIAHSSQRRLWLADGRLDAGQRNRLKTERRPHWPKEASMRTLLPKAFAFSIAALFLGGALAATPACAMTFHPGGGGGGFHPGGGGGGFYHGGGGGGFHPSGGGSGFYHGAPGGFYRFNGAPSSGGALSHPNLAPSANFASHPPHVPYTGPSWSKTGNQHHRFWRHWRHRYGWGGGVIAPELCDDSYCDNGAYYDDSDCWVLRRVYNRYGKFAGWRRVYICQDEQ